MGCDIHLYAEKRDGDKWTTLDRWVKEYDDVLSVPYKESFYHNRNYNLFSILADVRNGRGFAGCKTGEGFVPIAPPRGIPADACEEYKNEVALMDGDGHSHSWFTVAELMAYDWTQETTLSGIVNLRGLARWKLNGQPDEWSGMITGHGIEIFPANVKTIEACFAEGATWWTLFHSPDDVFGSVKSPDEKWADTLRNVQARYGCERPHFNVSWPRKYYQVASEFLGETLPRLWRCGAPEDVRIVFFFDN
jgi:hypothetical protein